MRGRRGKFGVATRTVTMDRLNDYEKRALAEEKPEPDAEGESNGARSAIAPETSIGLNASEIAGLLDVATEHLAAGRWSQAHRVLPALLDECGRMPEEARERLGKISLGVAEAADAAGEWKLSATLLRRMASLGMAAETATARLAVARQREEGEAHLARAQAAFASGRWQECLEAAEAAVAVLPTSILARELRHSAEAEIDKEEKRRRAAELVEEKRRRRRAAIDRVLTTAKLNLATKPGALAGQGADLARGLLNSLQSVKIGSTKEEVHNDGPSVAQASAKNARQVDRVEPVHRRVIGELPAGWAIEEPQGEDQARRDADFGATFGLGAAGEAKVALARHYIAKNPDGDHAYTWLARHFLLAGDFEQGRQALAEGLANCARRRGLCQIHGWLELEAGRLNEAVEWWLRSANLQLAVRRLDTHEPFLYLGYLATFYGLDEDADRLFLTADRIRHQRLTDSGANDLNEMAAKGNKQEIVEALQALGSRLAPEV